MKSIYLDTSNIALLTKVKTKAPKRFEEFRELWVKNSLVLALSKAHLFEIVRHGSQEEIQYRFNLIETLLPIRSEMNLFNKEILLAFIEKNIFSFKDEDKEVRPNIFGDFIYTPDQFFQFRAFMLDFMKDIFNLTYKAHTASWKAHSSDPQLNEPKARRLKDLSKQEMSADDVIDIQEIFQQVVEDLDKNVGLPKEFLQQGLEFSKRNVEEFQSRVSEVGYLKAFAEFIEIDSNDNKVLRKSIDNLLNEFWFKMTVESAISEICDDINLTNSLTTKISIEDCPGIWLNKKVEFQLKRSGDFSTSNELDLEHISHLPYVDKLFADKRISSITKQVLAKKDKPARLENVNSPIAIPNTIEALEKALFD